jgi:hypothetical protein
MDTPEQVTPPSPIESKGPTPEPKPEPVKSSPTISDALKKANEKVKADAAKAEVKEPKVEPKADAKANAKPDAKAEVKSDGPVRGEDGKFAPKDPAKAEVKVEGEPVKDTPFREAPKRFSEDAKAAWEKAPDPIKAEAHRAIKELESGIQEYRQKYEPLKQYDEIARQNNTSIKDALDRYTGLERALASENPQEKFSAIQKVFDYAGINMREFAAQMAGVTPEQASVHQENTIRELRMELAAIKEQVGGVTGHIQQQQEATVMSQIEAFTKDHPRFDELSDDIAFFLQHKRANDLQEAYELAERLKPAPVKASALSPVIPEQPEAHTLRGQKSVAGSPSAGSSPAKGKPSPSIKEALQRALAKAS